MASDNVATHCVYHLRHAEALIKEEGAGTHEFSVKQSWRAALNHFQDANEAGQDYLIIFDHADVFDGVGWVAKVEAIDVVPDEGGQSTTTVKFSGLKPLPKKFDISELKRASDGLSVSPGYRRGYLPCYTPEKVSKAWKIADAPTLGSLGLKSINAELLAVECIYDSAEEKASVKEIYAFIASVLGLEEMPKNTWGHINTAVSKSHEGTGYINTSEGVVNAGWTLSEKGKDIARAIKAEKARTPKGDSELRWNKEIHAAVLLTEESSDLKATEREALVMSRIGQGKYRNDLIKHWNGKCCVTGTESPDLLRASHIVPWAEASNKQRLDPENGLLLNPSYDAAFDKGLITFSENGDIILSKLLPAVEAQKAGISDKASIKGLSGKNREYLKYHQERVFKR
jgi:hypothetical protein